MSPSGERERHSSLHVAAPPFSHAFQPIVDTARQQIYAYEALVRGVHGESASSVFDQVSSGDMHAFDRASRTKALAMAAQLGITCHVSLNVLPRGLEPTEVDAMVSGSTAQAGAFPLDRVILEVTEGEVIEDHATFAVLINKFRAAGAKVAIDDFGAGYSGLNLLAEFQPDLIKLDIKLVRGIVGNGPKQSIVRAISQVCVDMGIDVIAEGIEDEDDYWWCSDLGIQLFQGFLFARPGFECLPETRVPQ